LIRVTEDESLFRLEENAQPTDLLTDLARSLMEIGNADEWETKNGKLQPKAGTAPNGVSIGTEATSFSTDSGGVFSNVGSFVEFDTDHYQLLALGTNLASGQTSSYSGGWTTTGNASLTDGSELTNVYLATGATSETVTIDFGTATKFNRIRLMSAGNIGTPTGWTVEGSANNSDFTLLDTASGLTKVTTAGNYQEWFDLNDAYEYRYVRIQPTSTFASIGEVEISRYDDGVSTTVDFDTASGVLTIASSSLDLKDENDSTVGNTAMDIAYSLDNGSTFSAFDTYGNFKALGELATTNDFVIRHKLLSGGATLKSSKIDTPSTESLTMANGTFTAKVNGADVGKMSSAGYTFPDGTVQAKSVAQYLADLPTSDPLVAGEAWNNSGVVTISAG
jgi:hypothetical protein